MSLLLVCTLISVTDGDTFRASCRRDVYARFHIWNEYRIRIANIDAPEKKQCPVEAEAARGALEAMLGGDIRVEQLYMDRYDRVVGIVTTDAIPGGDDDMSMAQTANVGEELVLGGYAKPWLHNENGKALEPKPKGC